MRIAIRRRGRAVFDIALIRGRASGSGNIIGAVRAFAFALCALTGLLLPEAPSLAASAPAAITPGQFNVTGTGAFTYSIPIAVPPGTAGMVPALSLDYSSQNASDGLEGWGWALSGLPSITRCPRTYAQ